ncbi:MAG: hypothetical protein QG627_132 [Chlamydiota bacterium]|nr:hypothetical protein [Chlamydiota bacterium]
MCLTHKRYFMTWPTDLARRSTNPCSPQALSNERSRIDLLNRNDHIRLSDSRMIHNLLKRLHRRLLPLLQVMEELDQILSHLQDRRVQGILLLAVE